MARRARDNPLIGSAKHIKKLAGRRDSKFMTGLGVLWVWTVQNTAWHGPPAKRSTIIFEKKRAKLTVKVGWYAYKSGAAGSRRRMELRLPIFFGRVEKKIARRKKASAIRGTSPALIRIKVGHR